VEDSYVIQLAYLFTNSLLGSFCLSVFKNPFVLYAVFLRSHWYGRSQMCSCCATQNSSVGAKAVLPAVLPEVYQSLGACVS